MAATTWTAVTTTTTTTAAALRSTDVPVDVAFVLDSSCSLGADGRGLVKQFAASVVDLLPIGPTQTQFAMPCTRDSHT